METECTTEQMEFQQLGRRRVIGRFDGGKISSDAGGVLLREVENRLHILKRLARDCFRDYRDEARIEHTVESLIRQRVYGIALGYVDPTDDPLHGNQEGKYFHGYYAEYCYLPLYIFSGEHLLCARLRPANEDPASGVRQELERIVKRLKAVWPEVRIIVRGDSGFCREEIMSYCERESQLDYVLGLAKNSRLIEAIGDEMAEAKQS